MFPRGRILRSKPSTEGPVPSDYDAELIQRSLLLTTAEGAPPATALAPLPKVKAPKKPKEKTLAAAVDLGRIAKRRFQKSCDGCSRGGAFCAASRPQRDPCRRIMTRNLSSRGSRNLRNGSSIFCSSRRAQPSGSAISTAC